MLASLARTLGPVPGGLGVFEAASVTALKLNGVPIAAGLAATLLFRGFSYWLPMLPGILLARREANGSTSPPHALQRSPQIVPDMGRPSPSGCSAGPGETHLR